MTTGEHISSIENIRAVASLYDRKYVTGINYDGFFIALEKLAKKYKLLANEYQSLDPLSTDVLGNLTSAYRYTQIKHSSENLPPTNSKEETMITALDSIFETASMRNTFAEGLSLPFSRSQVSRYESVLLLPFESKNNQASEINLLDLGCGSANLGCNYIFSELALKRTNQIRESHNLPELQHTPNINVLGTDKQRYNIAWTRACSTLGIPNNPLSIAMDIFFDAGYEQIKRLGPEKTKYLQHDLKNPLPIQNNFDIITCFFVLQQQKPRTIFSDFLNDTVKQLLCEKGLFLFADGDTRSTDPLNYYIKIWQKIGSKMVEIGPVIEMRGDLSYTVNIVPGYLNKIRHK